MHNIIIEYHRSIINMCRNQVAIDNTSTKKAHVRWLHKKLIPALCHDLLQDFPSLEAILHMDGVNHRNACLGALLHVARLVHDPFIVIPHRVVSSVRVLLNLLYPPAMRQSSAWILMKFPLSICQYLSKKTKIFTDIYRYFSYVF